MGGVKEGRRGGRVREESGSDSKNGRESEGDRE